MFCTSGFVNDVMFARKRHVFSWRQKVGTGDNESDSN